LQTATNFTLAINKAHAYVGNACTLVWRCSVNYLQVCKPPRFQPCNNWARREDLGLSFLKLLFSPARSL